MTRETIIIKPWILGSVFWERKFNTKNTIPTSDASPLILNVNAKEIPLNTEKTNTCLNPNRFYTT